MGAESDIKWPQCGTSRYLHTVLLLYTVNTHECLSNSCTLETGMNHQLRQHYQPKVDRLPHWLHRVWAWF